MKLDIHRTLAGTLLDYNRKSVTLMKLCCEHKMYLWSRSTHCQNFKTIPWPLAEILVIQKKTKNKGLVTFHSNIFKGTKFCKHVVHAWALTFWNLRQNTACRFWVISQNNWKWCPIRNSRHCWGQFSQHNTTCRNRPHTSGVKGGPVQTLH